MERHQGAGLKEGYVMFSCHIPLPTFYLLLRSLERQPGKDATVCTNFCYLILI